MKPLVIVEGESDRVLVSTVLDVDPVTRGRYKVQAAGGKSSAVSLARTYLATTDLYVIVVLDADTIDSGRVADEYGLALDLLTSAGRPDRFRLLMAMPSIETIFFTDRPTAATLFGRPLTDAEWVEAGLAPRAVLGRLIATGSGPAGFSHWLGRHDLAPLADAPLIRELRQSIAAPRAA